MKFTIVQSDRVCVKREGEREEGGREAEGEGEREGEREEEGEREVMKYK